MFQDPVLVVLEFGNMLTLQRTPLVARHLADCPSNSIPGSMS